MRELSLEHNGKILVLSDVHYPNCNIDEINAILDKENPSLIVLLGDIITSNDKDYQYFKSKLKINNLIYVKGDEDKVEGDVDIVKIRAFKKNYILLHGHQYFNERQEYSLAKTLKKINKNLPPLLFCIIFKIITKNFNSVLILGHSHALVYFKSINCANAGTLSNITYNVYNDKGYLIIDKEGIKIEYLK
jgi:putative phosphoesterase